jgi:cation diffusion facilitator CzcD-associated flavoprotein CzcO
MFQHQTAIIGAGPFGLAVAAELRRLGVEHVLIGRPMAYWLDFVPQSLNLLSDPLKCSLSADQFKVEQWEQHRGKASTRPFPGREFVEYCTWFAQHACVEPRIDHVRQVRRNGQGFVLQLQSGDVLHADRVVVAVGLKEFAYFPDVFSSLGPQVCSHTGTLKDLDRFRGQNLAVIGGGQSALEYAVLLSNAGAQVEVLAREQQPFWYPYGRHVRPTSENGAVRTIRQRLRALINHPEISRRFPPRLQTWRLAKSLRPAVDDHLKDRLQTVKLTFGRSVCRATCESSGVTLDLNDQSQRHVDHVILATGFHIDPSRIAMLDPDLVREIRTFRGYPRLNGAMESTARGLYFAGAPAAMTYGTDMWFVHGSPVVGVRISRSIVKKAAAR